MCCIVGKVSLSFPTPIYQNAHFQESSPAASTTTAAAPSETLAPGGGLRRVSSEPVLGGPAVEPAGEPELPLPETGDIDQNILDTLDYLASIPEEQWWQPYSPKEDMD